MRKLSIPGLAIIISLALLETGLRMMMGNMANIELLQLFPDDGRCLGLIPSKEVKYTGWGQRLSPVIHEVNSLGYRGVPLPEENHSRHVRILVLGDSYVYGQGVTWAETMPYYLQTELNSFSFGSTFDVLNFGISGHNIEDIADQYANYARKWSADVVLVMLGITDLGKPQCDWAKRFSGSPIRQLLWSTVRDIQIFRATVWMTRFAQSFWDLKYGYAKTADEVRMFQRRTKEFLMNIHNHLKPGTVFGIVMTGDPLQYIRAGSLRNLTPFLQQSEIQVIDIRGVARSAQRIKGEGHFSPAGNSQIAESVAPWILRMRISDPS